MQRHDWPGEREISKRMLLTSLGVAAVISLALLFCMPTVLKFVGNPEYVALIGLFPWLLLGNLLIVAGLIPHLRLYALHRDSLLMRIFLFVVPIAVLANLLLVPRFGFHGVVAVFVGTAALQAALNFYFAKVAAEQNK